MPKITKDHNSRSIFSKFLQKLIRLSTHHYQSIHEVFKALASSVLRYFTDKVKMPKFQRAITHKVFFRIYSKINQIIIITNPFTKFHGSSSNIFWDILLTRWKCPKLLKAITQRVLFKNSLKVNQFVYLSLSVYLSSIKALAPTIFEIFCRQGKNGQNYKGP